MAVIVVTDGEQRPTLAVVRSLGRAGHRVIVCAAARNSLAGSSRFSAEHFVVPKPNFEAGDFVSALASVVDATGADSLIPMSEHSALAVLADHLALPTVRLPFPRDARFARLCDKQDVLEVARSLGILTPTQHVIADKRETADLDHSALRWPLAIKPIRSVNSDGRGVLSKASTSYASTSAELSRILENTAEHEYPLLLQQRVFGKGVGVFLLIWQDRLIAAFSHERLREKPPTGGVCVNGRSRPLPSELLEKTTLLLRSFDWQGVAMVEFKEDLATGALYLMEVNPRFWGSLQLAIDSGVDFPKLLLEAMHDRQPEPVLAYREGMQTRWYWGEVDHLIALAKQPDWRSASGSRVMSPLRTALDVLPPWKMGTRNEVFRLSDPLPFFHETAAWFSTALRATR